MLFSERRRQLCSYREAEEAFLESLMVNFRVGRIRVSRYNIRRWREERVSLSCNVMGFVERRLVFGGSAGQSLTFAAGTAKV